MRWLVVPLLCTVWVAPPPPTVDAAIETVRMTIVSKRGHESVRELEMRSRRTWFGTRMRRIRFTAPQDIAGTTFLSVDRRFGDDDRFLYLPMVKRANVISPTTRGSLVGSDFTLEDLALLDRFEGRWTVRDAGSYRLIDARPSRSAYTGLLVTTERDGRPRTVEFFDPEGLVKILDVVSGDDGLPALVEMRDVRRGTSTRLELLSRRVNPPRHELPDETFVPGAW